MRVIVSVKIPLIISSFILFQTSAISAEKDYKVGKKTLSVYTPKNWQVAPNFMGSDLKFLGPYKNERRPVITFDYIPFKNYEFDKARMSHNHGNYIQGRKDWLLKNNGSAITFFNYEVIKWKNIKEVHTTGYKYLYLGKKYIEKTFFFKCKGSVYNINSLFTDKELIKNKKDLKKILNSISC